MESILLCLFVMAAADENVLINPGFDGDLAPWVNTAAHIAMEPVTEDGRSAARMIVPDAEPVSWPMLCQTVPAAAGDLYDARVDAKGKNVRDGFGVYFSVEFLDGQGERLSFTQSAAAPRNDAWQTLRVQTIVPEGCATLRFSLLLNGHGEAYFDDAGLRKLANVSVGALDGPVTLSVTDDVVCRSLLGFGAEDDGWFYSEENAEKGVTEDDAAIREGRIDWMDPDWVRMFCWYKDWNPSGDWETFVFDTPNMLSHYRTLNQYQRLGAVVNLTGVEWGMQDPYSEPERVAKAIGALFEHLVRAKGYTCVQEWTLSNEPNGAFASQWNYDFERFLTLHRLVKKEFKRRGLGIRIVGSDDTGGLPWFEQCVQSDEYFGLADFFASHRYLAYSDRYLATFFYEDRLKLLAARTPVKPFVVAEFGFQDSRSGTLENPIMEEYPYTIWTTSFIIDGLNRGVAGFSIWCLSEVYYPGNGFMNYGLWDFKDNGWKVRPVYHAFAQFSRLTERGDRVRRCESSHPHHVSAALAGKTLFWVNRAEEPAEVRVEGIDLREVRIMTEATLEGDRECGTVERLTDNRFQAPPQSFGYAR